ncbi:MAG: ribonuclease H-like domain-containing protein [Verrucomicrobia bacterium]|nr:ribonuclease H-like domain-containing protein [Verrucomicrobiota bacterium]
MPTLVFDIETASVGADQLDEAQRRFLYRDLESISEPDLRERREAQITRMLNLWPLTAQIVCIGMVNPETMRGQALYIAEDYEESGEAADGLEFAVCMDEAELLQAFWEVAKHYDRVVTFNGRSFDVPFLYLRSAILNVPITRKNWLGYRYATEPHCDLAEQLTFYGVSGREGAARKFNLDFYCKAFGIHSPKEEGVTGADVNRLVAEKRFREIAEYCVRDVQATAALYKIWQERLAGIS